MMYVNETYVKTVNRTEKVLKNNTDSEKKEEENEEGEEQKVEENTTTTNSTDQNVEENLTNTNSTDTETQNKTKEPEYEFITISEEKTFNKVHKYRLNREKKENITYLNQKPELVREAKDFLKSFQDYEEEKTRYIIKKNELESYIQKLKNWATETENM